MSTDLAKQPPAKPSIKGLITSPTFKEAMAQVLPKHCTSERMSRVAITALTRTPKLAECDQASFARCMMDLSSVGLEPDGRLAHLIPFENRARGIVECQLIIDYKGLVQLALRSGDVASIHADIVCANDDFDVDLGLVTKHRIDYRKARGEMYAVWAMCVFKNGAKKCEVMTRDEIDAVRSRSKAGKSGPWVSDYNEMAKKTVFRRLSKWIPLSAEIREAFSKDDDHDPIEPVRVTSESPRSVDDLTRMFAIPEVTVEASAEDNP